MVLTQTPPPPPTIKITQMLIIHPTRSKIQSSFLNGLIPQPQNPLKSFVCVCDFKDIGRYSVLLVSVQTPED